MVDGCFTELCKKNQCVIKRVVYKMYMSYACEIKRARSKPDGSGSVRSIHQKKVQY